VKDATDIVAQWKTRGITDSLTTLIRSNLTKPTTGIDSFEGTEGKRSIGIRVRGQSREAITIEPSPFARKFLADEREKGIHWKCVIRGASRGTRGIFVWYLEENTSPDEVEIMVPRGVWLPVHIGDLEYRIRRTLEHIDPALTVSSKVNEIIDALEIEAFDRYAARALGYREQGEAETADDPQWILTGRDLLNLENGMFDWRAGLIKPWSKDYWSKVRIPCKWPLTEAETQEWVGLVKEAERLKPKGPDDTDYQQEMKLVLKKSQQWVEQKLREKGFGKWLDHMSQWIPEEESRWFLQEYFGYCLIPEAASRTVVFLYGTGSNGKSRVTEALRSLLGTRNCLEQPLEAVAEGRFTRVGLDGKLVNLCGELEGRLLKGTSVIKEIAGGGTINAEVKFGPSISFRSTVRLIFATNHLPRTEDISEGWFLRVRIIEFPNKFKANPGFQLQFDSWVRDNRDLLLLWAMEGLRRYKLKGYFTESEAMTRAVEEYRGRTDTVAWFLSEVLTRSSGRGAFLPTPAVWKLFVRVCEESRRQACSEVEFRRRLKDLGIETSPRRYDLGQGLKSMQCCTGVQVKEEYMDMYMEVLEDIAAEYKARRLRSSALKQSGIKISQEVE